MNLLPRRLITSAESITVPVFYCRCIVSCSAALGFTTYCTSSLPTAWDLSARQVNKLIIVWKIEHPLLTPFSTSFRNMPDSTGIRTDPQTTEKNWLLFLHLISTLNQLLNHEGPLISFCHTQMVFLTLWEILSKIFWRWPCAHINKGFFREFQHIPEVLFSFCKVTCILLYCGMYLSDVIF